MSLLEIAFYATMGVLVAGYTLFLALLAVNARPYSPAVANGELPSVTLVIPTYNEAAVIRRKLANVLELAYPRDKLEVMVIDSASTDDTRDVVTRFANDHMGEMKIRLVEQETRMGKTEALNEALSLARSEVFALTDADVTFPPDSLRKLVSNLEDPKIGAASGVEVPVGNSSHAHNIESDYRRIYTAIRMAEASIDTPFMCESELSVYRRDILQPLQSGGMCDDVELTVEVRSKGYKSKYDLYSPFFEAEAGTILSKLKHKFRRGMANQHALFRNSNVLLNRTFGRYGSVVYPFEFFVHAVSPILCSVLFSLFVVDLILSPLSGLIAAAVTLALAGPSLMIIRRLMRKYSSSEISKLKGTGSWILGALAFLAFQGVLLASLAWLAVKGPQVKWEQVAETRSARELTVPTTVAAAKRLVEI